MGANSSLRYVFMSPLTVPCPRQMLFSVRVRESGPEMRGFVEIADPTQSLGGETEPPAVMSPPARRSDRSLREIFDYNWYKK